MKRRGFRFGGNLLSPETNQLINCRHPLKTPLCCAAAASGAHKPGNQLPVNFTYNPETGNQTYQKEKKESSDFRKSR
jgi:hypothetical protein